ncbi:MAG: apolipoprotein N-acyltransferase [Planctomycetales bacterium]|nr:apolipoprotein N-acyltransferase [Planctomycetales bacterium]
MWLAYPPMGLFPLAWVAPIGWLFACEYKTVLTRRDYFWLWISGCAFWLATLEGVRLVFWALYFGWVAISLYLAAYIPLFVGATRILRHRWRWPLELAAPVAWCGLEVFRSYFLTGFSSNTLAHSQVPWPTILQIADQLGGTGISFLMVATAASCHQLIVGWGDRKFASAAAVFFGLATAVAICLAYGSWRLKQADALALAAPLMRVLLVQENTPSVYAANAMNPKEAWELYLAETSRLAVEWGPVDLVVWPETTFGSSVIASANLAPRGGYSEEELQAELAALKRDFDLRIRMLLSAAQGKSDWQTLPSSTAAPYLLIGVNVAEVNNNADKFFNSALLVGPDGRALGRYDKMHPVMFGEYVPLGPALGWLRDILGPGIQAGEHPSSFQVNQVSISPSICFDSMVPRLISSQVRELVSIGQAPDVLINITNDSWFKSSAILDHHLACSTLCAVENRRPMLVAANNGLSANIDGSGRVLAVSQRSAAGGVFAEPHRDNRWGLVQTVGYPLGWLCSWIIMASFCAETALWLRGRTKATKTSITPPH